MKETIYVKYNRTRKPLFQIRTSIIEENGKLWVEKTALIPDAKAHLCSLSKKQTALERHFTNLKPVRTELSEDGGTVRFPFIQGETLAEILGRKIQNGMAPVSYTHLDVYKRQGSAVGETGQGRYFEKIFIDDRKGCVRGV